VVAADLSDPAGRGRPLAALDHWPPPHGLVNAAGRGTMAGASAYDGARDNRHQLSIRAVGSDGEFVIDIGRDHLWLGRSDGFEAAPQIEAGGLFYNCDGPPNTLVDLALGKDVENCSPEELGARAVPRSPRPRYRSVASGQLEEVSRSKHI
jgi:hypothetical protein